MLNYLLNGAGVFSLALYFCIYTLDKKLGGRLGALHRNKVEDSEAENPKMISPEIHLADVSRNSRLYNTEVKESRLNQAIVVAFLCFLVSVNFNIAQEVSGICRPNAKALPNNTAFKCADKVTGLPSGWHSDECTTDSYECAAKFGLPPTYDQVEWRLYSADPPNSWLPFYVPMDYLLLGIPWRVWLPIITLTLYFGLILRKCSLFSRTPI